MIYRTLGSTGEKVSAIGVGGWHLGLKTVDEQLAIRIVRSAIDRGINFLDNSWDYNEGESELRVVQLTSRAERRASRRRSAHSFPAQTYARAPPWHASRYSAPARRHEA